MSDHAGEARRGPGQWVAAPERAVLDSLPELNHFCLQVLAEQAHVGCSHAAVLKIAQDWLALDAAARRRAAAHPLLLFDAGLSDPRRWQWLDPAQVHDVPPETYGAVFTVSQAIAASEMVFVYAWSLARRHPVHARLALGMHPLCVRWITEHSVLAAHQMGARLWMWLRPRWLNTPEFWDELLQAAAEGGAAHLQARMQGVRLLAAEAATALRSSGYEEPD